MPEALGRTDDAGLYCSNRKLEGAKSSVIYLENSSKAILVVVEPRAEKVYSIKSSSKF